MRMFKLINKRALSPDFLRNSSSEGLLHHIDEFRHQTVVHAAFRHINQTATKTVLCDKKTKQGHKNYLTRDEAHI